VSRSLAGATGAFVSSSIGLVGALPNGVRDHWAGAGLGDTRCVPSAGLHWESTSCWLVVIAFGIRGGGRCGARCRRRGRVFGVGLRSCLGSFGADGIEIDEMRLQ
jgi:hypothetical protein